MTNYTAIANGAAADAATFNAPIGSLASALEVQGGGASATSFVLAAWVEGGCYELTANVVWDSDGVVSSADVNWPDNSAGVFERTSKNATWLAVDAYTVSHTDSGQTVTQAAVTRDSNGQVTTKPALTVA